MKRAFDVYFESGYDTNGVPVTTKVKTFKNEPDAVAFFENPRNERRYKNMTLTRTVDGETHEWDPRKRDWK